MIQLIDQYGEDMGAVEAEVFGMFAVHPTVRGREGQFQLTHVRSGAAILERVRHDDAFAAAHELNASGIDWSAIDGQNDLTAAHKSQGRELRTKYPSDPVVHVQRRKVGR